MLFLEGISTWEGKAKDLLGLLFRITCSVEIENEGIAFLSYFHAQNVATNPTSTVIVAWALAV